MRKFKLTWAELAAILKRQDNGNGNDVHLNSEEEIKEITLVKPREILIRAELRRK